MAKPAAAAQHTTGDEVEDGVMATSSQYFGFLFARWRQEQAKDLTKTMHPDPIEWLNLISC